MIGNNFELSNLSHIKSIAADYSLQADNYVYMKLSSAEAVRRNFGNAWCFNGMCMMINHSGLKSVEVNTESFPTGQNAMIVIAPDHIVRTVLDSRSPLDVELLFVSREFVHDINLNPNAIDIKAFTTRPTPAFTPDASTFSFLCRMVHLLRDLTRVSDGEIYAKSVARNLMAALFYELIGVASTRVAEGSPLPIRARKAGYVHDFIELVARHYRSERSVKFYAGKLFVTPKYLSVLIREATGQSAVTWIDNYVIREAKNMLRYSGKNIQQIAYELNFSNQSSFGKYFKNITGVSPSEFRHSS